MAELSNAELTRQLSLMQANLATFESQLEQILPKMDTAIAQSTGLSDDLRDKITKYVEPSIQLDLKNVLMKMNDDQQIVNNEMEIKLSELSDLVKRMIGYVMGGGLLVPNLCGPMSLDFREVKLKL